MTKYLLAAIITIALAAPAEAIPCQGAGDLSLLVGGCDAGVLHFSDFQLTATGPAGVSVTAFLTDVVDSTLAFDIVTAPLIFPGTLNVSLSYAVTDDPALAATPEPGTLLLLGSTLTGLGLWWRRQRP